MRDREGRQPPAGRPVASVRGGAYVHGRSTPIPAAKLDVYESALVIKPGPLLRPVIVERAEVGALHVGARLFTDLRLAGPEGEDLDIRFAAVNGVALERALREAGWDGLFVEAASPDA